MNTRQRYVIAAGLALFVFAGLYPPWYAVDTPEQQHFPARGFWWIFENPGVTGYHLDLASLGAIWATIAVATAGLMVLLRPSASAPSGAARFPVPSVPPAPPVPLSEKPADEASYSVQPRTARRGL